MKLVAISQRIDFALHHGECRDSLDQNLVRFLLTCGFVPFPVPNCMQNKEENRYFDSLLARMQPNAIILSGGNNIGELASRDETELALMNYAEQRSLPLLGICRGMQLMAFKAGIRSVATTGHVATRHEVHGEITGYVNSFHNFSIINCPDKYIVLCESDDGVIEAIKHKTLPWEGWMWHPEREPRFERRDIERLRNLFGKE